MQIDHLGKRVTRGVVERGTALLRLDLLIRCLCGSKRMVTVTNGKQQRRNALSVTGTDLLRGDQALQRRLDTSKSNAIHKATDHRSALLHQLERVSKGQGRSSCSKGLDHGLCGIVDQQHHVRQLDRSITAHLKTGRNTLHHGPFRGANERA